MRVDRRGLTGEGELLDTGADDDRQFVSVAAKECDIGCVEGYMTKRDAEDVCNRLEEDKESSAWRLRDNKGMKRR